MRKVTPAENATDKEMDVSSILSELHEKDDVGKLIDMLPRVAVASLPQLVSKLAAKHQQERTRIAAAYACQQRVNYYRSSAA